MATKPVPRIESLRVKNYRVLRDVEFKRLTPLSVLTGPNGAGKSTVFDVFAFLSECFNDGVRKAWDKRGRFRELRSRGQEGPISIEVRYREAPQSTPITYHLIIDEVGGQPVVALESLRWSRKGRGRPFEFLKFENGSGQAIPVAIISTPTISAPELVDPSTVRFAGAPLRLNKPTSVEDVNGAPRPGRWPAIRSRSRKR